MICNKCQKPFVAMSNEKFSVTLNMSTNQSEVTCPACTDNVNTLTVTIGTPIKFNIVDLYALLSESKKLKYQGFQLYSEGPKQHIYKPRKRKCRVCKEELTDNYFRNPDSTMCGDCVTSLQYELKHNECNS